MHTQPPRPHQKRKKQSAIANRSDTVAKALSTNISIVLMKLVYLQKNGSNVLIMGFSLMSPYNGLFKLPPSGLFTNKFLHVSINNKIIFINRKETYTFPNSSTKATDNQIRSSTTK
jgi:hypothetical protein